MKILLFFAMGSIPLSLEACFCKSDRDDAQEPCLLKNNESIQRRYQDSFDELRVKQKIIFFESLQHNHRQELPKRLVCYPSNKQFSDKNNTGSDYEAPWYKELREAFERGDLNAMFGVYKKPAVDVVEQPLYESEDVVAARVIKELMPGKVFSKERAQECNNFLTLWMSFVESYGIGVPRDYRTTSHYLKNLLETKH